MSPFPLRFTLARALLGILVLPLAACGTPETAQPAPAAGPPATPVRLQTLEERVIPHASEFIATVRSRTSITVQPEVDGVVTRIFVKSGDRVRPGAPLVQIDAARQQQSVRGSEAGRAGAQSDVQYWRQQVARLESLVEAGAISRQEFDQAQNSLRAAEARLDALEAQLKEGQVQLQYYRVTAPQAGVVGDIPVHEGDRVTTATVITTIDDNDELEIYIDVPLDRAPDLRTGLPVELLDQSGAVTATNPITFVAPRVEPGTQSVLAKVLLKNPPATLRSQQFVRARIVWRSEPGITLPVVAVNRIGSQYFCFVAEESGGSLVARQRPVQVGEVLGDDYIITAGLEPGERVVVSGIQKIGDGAPIEAQQP